jgi:hypothetical protein
MRLLRRYRAQIALAIVVSAIGFAAVVAWAAFLEWWTS